MSSMMTREIKSNNEKLPLETMTCKEIKGILKERGLPVSGKKAELIERLKNGSKGNGMNSLPRQKPKPWQHSNAKKELKRALLVPSSNIHNMSIEEIRNSKAQYQEYPNFAEYYKNLKLCVEAEMAQVRADDIAAVKHIQQNPRKPMNQRGYPHWDTHAAKKELESDVAKKCMKE